MIQDQVTNQCYQSRSNQESSIIDTNSSHFITRYTYVPDVNTSMILACYLFGMCVFSVAVCAVVSCNSCVGRGPAFALLVQVAGGAQAGLGLVSRRLIVLLRWVLNQELI